MKRNKHSLTHWRLQSFNMGKVVPIACLEVLPGDTFRHQTSALLRVTPLVAPVMHPVHVQIHHWFVPNRILWASWEDFITDPDSALTVPTITLDQSSGASTLALADAMGIGHNIVPATSGATRAVNALAFRAYNKIINEFYFDQDLDTPLTEETGDTDLDENYTLVNARWAKDYFTTARTAPAFGGDVDATVGGGGTTLNINELRRAMAEQRLREHRNRFGHRYVDYLAFLGVTASDRRLQRPEYLGGGKQTISFSEVLGTGTADTEGELGALGGHGIAAASSRPYKRFFEEHGYVLSFAIARPVPVYQSLQPRHTFRSTWDDFWNKEGELQGDQAIINREIDFGHSSQSGTFGYGPRYDEYRRIPSSVHGDFRSQMGTLDYWHYGRDLLDTNPALNSSFITCTPTDRVYVATAPDELLGMIRHRIAARRLVSKKGRSERR